MLAIMMNRDIRNGQQNHGFSLIEIMIVVVIFGVLAAVGIPELQRYLADSRMLATAQSFQAGMQTARAEAIRLNVNVDFVVTDETNLSSANVATTNPNGKSWLVRAPNNATPPALVVVDSRSVGEGTTAKIAVEGTRAIVTFNGLGAMISAVPVNFTFSHTDYTCTNAGGNFRCLRVQVGAGGQTKLCDPAVALTATGDSRRCI
jgi:type IV fimbrial biogenesis protein FimT